MTSPVTIQALPADFDRWDALLTLIRRSFAYMDGVIDPPSSAHRLTPETLRDKAQAETCLIALAGDRLVGCIFVARRQDAVYVGKLAVEESARGLGIGRLLMNSAERLALESGTPILELETRIELTKNHATFERLGFAEFKRTAHPGYDRITSITYRKRLSVNP